MTSFHPEVRDLIRKAETLGWVRDGFDGRGHPKLQHPVTGATYSVPSTPGDWRSTRNSIADLQRLSGRKLVRQRAGKYRAVKVDHLELHKSSLEVSAGAAVDELVAEADQLRDEFAKLAADGSRAAGAAARKVVARYEQVREAAERFHRVLPPIA